METAGATGTAGAASNAAQAPSGNPGQITSADSNPGHAGIGGTAGSAQKAVERAVRELGDADMDALVTITVDGKAQKVPLRDAVKRAQLEQASQAKMQQAAQIRQQAQQLIELAQSNPKQFFKLTGRDPVEFAEMTLSEVLAEAEMSPEQKELRDLKSYKEQAERERAEKQKQAEKAEFDRRVAEAQQSYNKEFVEAWKSTGLPPDPMFAQLLAGEMVAAKSKGEDLSWQQAAGKLLEKIDAFFPRILEQLDDDRFQRVLGNKTLDRVRKIALSKVRSAQTDTQTGATKRPPVSSARKVQKAGLNEREWEAAMMNGKLR